MANTERFSALHSPASSRFDGRRMPLATDAVHAREPSRAAAPRNPFASFAPSAGASRDNNAETKLYQVPRELIEIARARAQGAEPSGMTTPLAPRPDADLEATLREYTARLSSKPPRLPRVTLDDSMAIDVAVDAEGLEPAARAKSGEGAAPEPEPLLLERPSSRRPSSLQPSSLQPSSLGSGVRSSASRQSAPGAAASAAASRGWLVYAALCLMGLAASAHVLLAP
jgi:hypothetical protein